jgi:hypothetical protein
VLGRWRGALGQDQPPAFGHQQTRFSRRPVEFPSDVAGGQIDAVESSASFLVRRATHANLTRALEASEDECEQGSKIRLGARRLMLNAAAGLGWLAC